jgi:hypothetical protein
VVLEVGQVTEEVEVQANAAMVETRTMGVGQIMENQRIVELPLNGRNAQELLVLSGGAVQIAPAGGRSFPDRMIISSAGALGFSTDYRLDGIRPIDRVQGGSQRVIRPERARIRGQRRDEVGHERVSWRPV